MHRVPDKDTIIIENHKTELDLSGVDIDGSDAPVKVR